VEKFMSGAGPADLGYGKEPSDHSAASTPIRDHYMRSALVFDKSEAFIRKRSADPTLRGLMAIG
jgi:hypothetical protein